MEEVRLTKSYDRYQKKYTQDLWNQTFCPTETSDRKTHPRKSRTSAHINTVTSLRVFDAQVFLDSLETFHAVEIQTPSKKHTNGDDSFQFFLNDGAFSNSEDQVVLVQHNDYGIKVVVELDMLETVDVARGLWTAGFKFAKLQQ
jgi:hypothetical protein